MRIDYIIRPILAVAATGALIWGAIYTTPKDDTSGIRTHKFELDGKGKIIGVYECIDRDRNGQHDIVRELGNGKRAVTRPYNGECSVQEETNS